MHDVTLEEVLKDSRDEQVEEGGVGGIGRGGGVASVQENVVPDETQ